MRNILRIETAIIYWLIVFGIAAYMSYTDRKEYKEQCTVVPGMVYAEVPTSSIKKTRPLVKYVAGKDTNSFAVRGSLSLKVGDAIDVIYNNKEPEKAERFHTWYWFNFPLIIKIILIALFPFGIIWGLTALFKTKTIILPSNKPL
ncbi:MAG: hypothetical protein K0Q66_817 [Chitinophagaceae bacterium]|jgi:hypothetical protein|nr:hypothetical protein [Chitinophagaceae bacterium]